MPNAQERHHPIRILTRNGLEGYEANIGLFFEGRKPVSCNDKRQGTFVPLLLLSDRALKLDTGLFL